MNCLFRLDQYQILSVTVAVNETFDDSRTSHTGNMEAAIQIAPHAKQPRKFRLKLEVNVKPPEQNPGVFFPYLVAITGQAFFSFKEDCPPDEAERVLRLNGASILYGLLRAQVAQITAQSVHGQFLLPTMNFVELNEPEPRPTASRRTSKKKQG